MSTATGWDLVAEQRIAFADMIERLEDQADHATLCGHWTVHEVAGHLLTFTNLSVPRLMVDLAKNRFNYDVMNDKIAQRFAAEMLLPDIASDLRTHAAKKTALPGLPSEMVVSDVTVHRQDIRRPLGLGVDLEDAVITEVLGFLTTSKQAKVVDSAKLARVELVATDLDWRFGSGATVEGPAEAIMMALAGRPVASDLRGAGVATLLP